LANSGPISGLATYERDSIETEYGWQAVPNRVSVTVGEDDPIETTFDAANRPTSGDYSSDEDGRLLTRTLQNLTWDDLGRLIEVNNSLNTINGPRDGCASGRPR
jgi:YD repeat-containing protein